MERRSMGSARVPIVVASVVVVIAAVLVVASIRPAGSSPPSVASTSSPPTASFGATGLVLVGGPAAGYEMYVPASWRQATPVYAEAQRWVGGDATVMPPRISSPANGSEAIVSETKPIAGICAAIVTRPPIRGR